MSVLHRSIAVLSVVCCLIVPKIIIGQEDPCAFNRGVQYLVRSGILTIAKDKVNRDEYCFESMENVKYYVEGFACRCKYKLIYKDEKSKTGDKYFLIIDADVSEGEQEILVNDKIEKIPIAVFQNTKISKLQLLEEEE